MLTLLGVEDPKRVRIKTGTKPRIRIAAPTDPIIHTFERVVPTRSLAG